MTWLLAQSRLHPLVWPTGTVILILSWGLCLLDRFLFLICLISFEGSKQASNALFQVVPKLLDWAQTNRTACTSQKIEKRVSASIRCIWQLQGSGCIAQATSVSLISPLAACVNAGVLAIYFFACLQVYPGWFLPTRSATPKRKAWPSVLDPFSMKCSLSLCFWPHHGIQSRLMFSL